MVLEYFKNEIFILVFFFLNLILKNYLKMTVQFYWFEFVEENFKKLKIKKTFKCINLNINL